MYVRISSVPEGGVVAEDLLADGDVGEEHELLHQRVRLLQLVHLWCVVLRWCDV